MNPPPTRKPTVKLFKLVLVTCSFFKKGYFSEFPCAPNFSLLQKNKSVKLLLTTFILKKALFINVLHSIGNIY